MEIKPIDKVIYLGTFETKEEAAMAYDKASHKYHGDTGRRNYE